MDRNPPPRATTAPGTRNDRVPAKAWQDLATHGRRLYKAAEDRVGPHLPRSLRAAWRRAIGRPPLPAVADFLGTAPGEGSADAAPGAGEMVAAHDALRHDVVCFPIIDWSFRFQRPQQLMREMARAGHRVFWINPTSLRDGGRLRPAAHGAAVASLAERVFDVRLAALAPRDHFKEALDPAEAAALLDALDDLRLRHAIAAAVSVVQLPFWAPLALAARERFGWRVVYDCMDDHAGFSSNDASMLAAEDDLLARSDAVVATSRLLDAKARARARIVHRIPNACEHEHFARAAGELPAPADVAAIPRPVVGYFGAISEWFDFDLLRHAAAAHPDWHFVLVGSTWGAGAHRDLAARSNVHLLGEKPYALLPAYLARMDVCTIPFRITPLTAATDPVKLYEYFAAGKPVVASPLPELEPHRDLVAIAATPEEFTAALERAIAEIGPAAGAAAGAAGEGAHAPERGAPVESSRAARAARVAFARANDWHARGIAFADACAATFPLASIVVVTWNNLDLTRRCLASVLADRTWPRFEIVVVDNASSDDTPAYLRELAAREPRVRIVLNDENRGFAAANNQGIAVARGETIVLLNNDTEVTRGWLARLVRALEDDDRLGLVGPVTNSVYNEARQEVSAADLARLPEFADRWARAHAGRIYPIKMLAMYCVAARRAVVDEIGPLDERFRIGMLEDDDYSHRVRLAGYRVACLEEAFVFHAGQASFQKVQGKNELQAENQARFEEKWSTEWHPYVGSRAESLRWRDEIARLADRARAAAREVIVFLPERRWDDRSPRSLEPLARALARAGHTVLFCLDAAAPPHALGLLPVEPRLFVGSVPLESLEGAHGAVAVVRATGRFAAAYVPGARLVYEAIDPEDAPAGRRREAAQRSHALLLHDAAQILWPAAIAPAALSPDRELRLPAAGAPAPEEGGADDPTRANDAWERLADALLRGLRATAACAAGSGDRDEIRRVERSMRDYVSRTPEDAYARSSLAVDAVRLARSLEWLAPLVGPGTRVLELGGAGVSSSVLRERFPAASLTTSSFDLREPFPLGGGDFDVVVAMEVIEHLADREYAHATVLSGVRSCLAEIARVLRVGGRLFLTTPNAASLLVIERALRHEPPWLYPYHFREFTPRELRILVETAGLHVERLASEYVWSSPDQHALRRVLASEGFTLDGRGDDLFLVAEKRAEPPVPSGDLHLPIA